VYVRVLQKEEGGIMGGIHMGKDDELDLDMEMELSAGSGSGHLDGLLGFADVEDDREHKPQHSEPDAAHHNSSSAAAAAPGGNGKKKRYHRHTAHQIQQMEA
jgi:hypothetical protein